MSDRPGSSHPRTRAEVESAVAQDAFQRGQTLLAAGDAAGARLWLQRARRFATDDDTVALSLSLALLALGDAGAETLLARLAERHDVQEIWLGLCAARDRAGDRQGAAAALAAALCGHCLADEAAVARLAEGVAARAGAAGWCGLRRDGSVVVRAAGRPRIRGRGTSSVAVTVDGRHLLGSPIDIQRIRRVEGCVWVRDGRLEGWAWHPGDAGRIAELTLVGLRGGRRRRIVADDDQMPAVRPLARPRRFFVPALRGQDGPVSVRGSDGRDLSGSPLDPGAELRAAIAAAVLVARALPLMAGRGRRVPWLPTPAALAGPPAGAPRRPRRPVAVIVPVYRGAQPTLACLEAVCATVPAGTAVVVVDDASPEPALRAALDVLAGEGRIRLLRHARNRGFVGAANAGLRAAATLPSRPDLVLLNSDTLPAPGWLERLRAVVHAAADIGTASPLSNDATILTYPDPLKPGPPPDLAAFAALAAETHPDTAIDIPTSVGFCMYLRRECLAQTGVLRADAFAQGYGEENDFCLRARHLGWRHVAVPGAFVAHLGGQSFGDARAALLERNFAVLERLHPGYRALIAAWQAADPLAPARLALDAARWAARPRAGRAVLLVTHDSGGGVERAVRERCAALMAEGRRPILLRPVLDRSGSPASLDRRYLPGWCGVGEAADGGFPNLRFRLPDEIETLADLLRPERPEWLEVHHLLGHDHAVMDLARRLGIPSEMRVHDYAWLCPRITLVNAERRYCGEPEVAVCDACVADAGSALEEPITPAALRARSAADFSAARLVVVPSADAASRLRRHFPTLRLAVAPHESDDDLPPLAPLPPPPRRVGVVGAIGIAKGYDVLLACARDAARRDLPLSFTVIGHTEDDARLLDTGRVFVTGPFAEADALALIREQAVHLAFLPSIWPETWCYALGAAWRAGLAAAAFDIGAPAERIQATGRGWLLPLGLPVAALNNALLALRLVAGDECARPTSARPALTTPPITARS